MRAGEDLEFMDFANLDESTACTRQRKSVLIARKAGLTSDRQRATETSRDQNTVRSDGISM